MFEGPVAQQQAGHQAAHPLDVLTDRGERGRREARELDIACAIRVLARRQYGLRTHIGSLVYDRFHTICNVRPRVWCTPYFYSCDDLGVRDMSLGWPGAPVVNLAFEQLFSAGNQQFKKPRDATAREQVLHLGESTTLD